MVEKTSCTMSNRRMAQSPAGAGLFIDNRMPQIFLFVFRRRESGEAAQPRSTAWDGRGASNRPVARRRKTKRNYGYGRRPSYKDATPTGFLSLDHCFLVTENRGLPGV